jgi:cytochrome c oxidase subunit 4
MIERAFVPRFYVLVCAILIVLTCLTVGISRLPIEAAWHTSLGLAIALTKATLVVLFFMHVLHSPKLTQVVIWITIYWLGILFVLTLTDYLSREMIPLMLGH